MDRFELDIQYNISDFTSATLARRKASGEKKNHIIVIWILGLLLLAYALPASLAPLLCIPFGVCSPEDLRGSIMLVAMVLGVMGLLLISAYTDFLYRLRVRQSYRYAFSKFKDEYQAPQKFVADDEGIEFQKPNYKIKVYWKAFQQIMESKEQFLLLMENRQFFVIPKRSFNSPEDMARLAGIIVTNMKQEIKKI